MPGGQPPLFPGDTDSASASELSRSRPPGAGAQGLVLSGQGRGDAVTPSGGRVQVPPRSLFSAVRPEARVAELVWSDRVTPGRPPAPHLAFPLPWRPDRGAASMLAPTLSLWQASARFLASSATVQDAGLEAPRRGSGSAASSHGGCFAASQGDSGPPLGRTFLLVPSALLTGPSKPLGLERQGRPCPHRSPPPAPSSALSLGEAPASSIQRPVDVQPLAEATGSLPVC